MTEILTAEQIYEQVKELRIAEGVGSRQVSLWDRFQDAANTIEQLQCRAEKAETEAKGLRIQVETMARLAAAREKQFAQANEKCRQLRDEIALRGRISVSMNEEIYKLKGERNEAPNIARSKLPQIKELQAERDKFRDMAVRLAALAKRKWGLDDGVSFDVVWAEALVLRAGVTPEAVIAKLAEIADAVACQAGVGGMEMAGQFVSILANHPEKIAPVLAGESLLDHDILFHPENGCLTWHAKDGRVVSPDELRAAKAERAKIKESSNG